MKQRKLKNDTVQAVPVTAGPLPLAVRGEIHEITRGGGTVTFVEDLGDHFYRIHYTKPVASSHLVMVAPNDQDAAVLR
jgi:hypothetical protein